ncbi:Putative ribosome-binding factor A, mitochondrial [Heterocephalus glaber]|uniref:Putative ribosome-binding factor A, mitochondrial n=1 Tax=Heterocephalus glaber TaxID=10181 RepID=G5BWG0_HETGA|nr:Putative ribosome-binding factor A, mitochondrial [Heterocephalus glaber]
MNGRTRGLRGSAGSYGKKNLLKKLASKSRKKFWYEGPSLGSRLTYKPSKLESLLKATSKKTRKEDHVWQRALNGLLCKALTDLLSTPEGSQEVYDLNVKLSKAPFDVQQTLKNVPPIVFMQDRRNALLAEVDRLLEIADDLPCTLSYLCGIDHEALNKQIMEYKQKNEKGLRDMDLVPPGQEPMAKLPQWVRRRKKAPLQKDQDTSPRSFLLDEDQDSTLGCGCESQRAEEWKAEPGGGGTQ